MAIPEAPTCGNHLPPSSESPFASGVSFGATFAIHTMDGDTRDARSHGRARVKTKRCPRDLTDEEWERIAPLLPKPGKRGRKAEVAQREVLNGIRYMSRSGGGWRMLPKDFPPWQTVYWWFRRVVRLMLCRTIHDILR